jgi:hypothetical protein
MDDARLTQLEKSIQEIKISQDKIATALLGSYEKNSVGLIEEARNLRRDVNEIQTQVKVQEVQIEEVLEFKSDAKKIVAGIAFAVPLVFEFGKILVGVLWESLKGK